LPSLEGLFVNECDLEGDLEKVQTATSEELQTLLFSQRVEVLETLLRNPNFTQREVLILLNRRDLQPSFIKILAEQRVWSAQHNVQLALLRNPKTPPHVSLQFVKFLFPFELMALCLLPAIPTEVKQAAEGLLIGQIPQLAIGQKIILARRGPSSVVKHLLTGDNPAIFQAVLNNPYLTEEILLQTLNKPQCSSGIVNAIAMHPKWSIRYPLRVALVRHPLIGLSLALRFLPELRPMDLRELCNDPRVNPELRRHLQNKRKTEKQNKKL
jgi:hypothetical protein